MISVNLEKMSGTNQSVFEKIRLMWIVNVVLFISKYLFFKYALELKLINTYLLIATKCFYDKIRYSSSSETVFASEKRELFF